MQTLKKSARTSKLEGKAIREGMQRTVGSYRATPHPTTKESPDILMFGRELRRKLPERIVPAGEIRYDPIRHRDAAKKEADERVRGQEAERPGKPYSGWRPSSFEAEQSRCSHPSI